MEKKKKHIRRGTVMIIIGLFMFVGALSVVLYDMYKEKTAGENSDEVLSELTDLISSLEVPSEEQTDSDDDILESLDSDYNVSDATVISDGDMEIIVEYASDEEETETETETETEGETLPEGVLDWDMPTRYVDGHYYIGIISMPTLGITLPVQWGWSDELMDISPCRYNGTLEENNLIIMAHNYSTHFGTISNLAVGDEVIFTDILGNVITYEVCGMDVFHRSEVSKMYEGDWDLTLFTCVPNTYNRVAVRCKRVE